MPSVLEVTEWLEIKVTKTVMTLWNKPDNIINQQVYVAEAYISKVVINFTLYRTHEKIK